MYFTQIGKVKDEYDDFASVEVGDSTVYLDLELVGWIQGPDRIPQLALTPKRARRLSWLLYQAYETANGG